jgi:hypothetical protein
MLRDFLTIFISFYPRQTARETAKNRANFPGCFLSQLKLRDANKKRGGFKLGSAFSKPVVRILN